MAFRFFAASVGSMLPPCTALRMSPDAVASGSVSNGANLRSSVSPWVRFTWQTASLPNIRSSASTDLIRPALKEESQKVLNVILQSLSMDSSWNASLVKVEQYLRDAVSRVFAQDEPMCLVIPKGNRLIAASLLDPSEAATGQLLSGPVVLVEYQNRGIGTQLLHASLDALRDRGLFSVNGVTRTGSIGAQHVYPKFGGLGESIRFPFRIEALQEAKA